MSGMGGAGIREAYYYLKRNWLYFRFKLEESDKREKVFQKRWKELSKQNRLEEENRFRKWLSLSGHSDNKGEK